MNDYDVVRQIGEGAFGKVFLVRHKGAGGDRHCVVVKQIDLRKVRLSPTFVPPPAASCPQTSRQLS